MTKAVPFKCLLMFNRFYYFSVRYLYYLWIAHAVLYSLNLLVGILYLFAGGDQGKFFGLAFIYWAFFVPLSYICWFRPAYKAFKNNSSVLMKTFFIGLSCQFFICVLHFLGIHGSGSSGIILGYNVLVSLRIIFFEDPRKMRSLESSIENLLKLM